MSNFKLIDQTKTAVSGSDLLVAGSIVGSFLFFVIKSQKNKVVVLHKKSKSKAEIKAIDQGLPDITDSLKKIPPEMKPHPLNLKSRLPIKTYLFNAMTMKAFQGKGNAFDFLKNSKDAQDFMSLIPKPKQIPIERMLLSESELEELREIAAHNSKKKERSSMKQFHTEGNLEESEDRWSIREYDAQDFDLENVYDDFLDSQKRRILQKHTRKNSSGSRKLINQSHNEKMKKGGRGIIYDSPFMSNISDVNEPDILINIDGEGIEDEEYKDESMTTIAKKTNAFEIESPETQAILKRYEEAAKKLTENPFNYKKNTFITRKEAETRVLLLNNLHMNCLINFSENGDYICSIKHTFNLKTLNYEDDLFLDYSGKYIISVSINQKSIKPSDVWFENKIILPAKYLKEGQNTVSILVQNESLDYLDNLFEDDGKKFIDPNKFETFCSRTFFNHPDRTINSMFPLFDQPGFIVNIILGILVPKIYYVVTSSPEKLNQPIKEDSKFNSLKCHETIFNNMEDFMDKRLLLFQLKTDPTVLGFCFGEILPIFEKENLRFFSFSENKEKLLEIISPASEIMQLGICTFKKFLKNPITKIDILILPGLPRSIFSYQGLIFIEEKLILSKENLAEFYFVILAELAKQFLLNRMKWYDDIWIFEGLPNYLASVFFDQIADIDNITQNLPFSEIVAFMTYLKQKAICVEVLSLSHPLYGMIENNYKRFSLQEPIIKYKSMYVFKQLFLARGKKSLADIFLKLNHYITNKDFIDLINDIENNQFQELIEDCLTVKGINEIEIEVHGNGAKATTLKEFVVFQKEFGKEQEFNLKTHYTDILFLNQSCRSQFSLDIKIKKEKESVFHELDGKYLPKAVLIDSEDCGYFKVKLDQKSFSFLLENLNKVDQPKTRLNLYYCFYFEMLDGKLNLFEFLNLVLKHLEKENSFIVLKYILKLSQPLIFLGLAKEKEIEYSEKFLFLILKLIEQGKFPNLLYKYIQKFSSIPTGTSLLESIYNEKHTSLTRYYKNFSDNSKMKLLSRIIACESINNEKRTKYLEDFIESTENSLLKQKCRLVFQASTPSEEEKNKIWFVFAENIKNIKLSTLKAAFKAFIQSGQYVLNEMYCDKYFEDLPLIINKHDEEYALCFTKSIFPKDILKEEYILQIKRVLEKIDEEGQPRITNFLKEKSLIIRKMIEVVHGSVINEKN